MRKTRTWNDNLNNVIRDVFFPDEELLDLMLIPENVRDNIVLFHQKYFVEDVTSDELVTTEDVTVAITYAAGNIGTRGASESLGTTVKANHTYIGAYIVDNRNTSAFNATVQGNGPNNTAHLCAYRATGNAVSNASVTVRKVWLKTGGA